MGRFRTAGANDGAFVIAKKGLRGALIHEDKEKSKADLKEKEHTYFPARCETGKTEKAICQGSYKEGSHKAAAD